MPDHRVGRIPELDELENALNILRESMLNKPVFIHCVAAIERSPLVSMAWLIIKKNLTPITSLEYMIQVHPRTNPLAGQLSLLNDLVQN